MPEVFWTPATGRTEPLQVTVGECVYTISPVSPTFIPSEHLAAVSSAIVAASAGSTVSEPTGDQ